jgi:hypothetical protein
MRKIALVLLIIFSVSEVFSQTKISSSTFGKMEARWLGPWNDERSHYRH